ncbi:MAG TPA: Cj0069 family protein, partial [Propionibacteriaceae bacterium]|nr:Cj0069 family protein [Propionibacteriaceae bacterium]
MIARPRIGLLSRGDHASGTETARAQERLAPLYAAFAELSVTAVPVIYDDEHVDEVRQQVLGLDGLLVWVNPVQDGLDRSRLDVLLREVADAGVWVSAHPDVILGLGTKEVLYSTRGLGWGTDTDVFRSPTELATRLPGTLARHRTLVLKQGRGMGGVGVWKVAVVSEKSGPVTADTVLHVQHAADGSAPRESRLADFVADCEAYFTWSGLVVTQPYQQRLADGMIRAYFVHDRLVGFQHQWPTALLAEPPSQAPRQRVMEDPDTPDYAGLRHSLETAWIPGLQSV